MRRLARNNLTPATSTSHPLFHEAVAWVRSSVNGVGKELDTDTSMDKSLKKSLLDKVENSNNNSTNNSNNKAARVVINMFTLALNCR